MNNEDVWWIEHSIARDTPILELHSKISSFLQERGVKLINDSGNLYRPHLTLARVRASEVKLNFSSFLGASAFELGIGKADECGQFVQLLEKF